MKKFAMAMVTLLVSVVLSAVVVAEDITIVGTGDGVTVLEAVGKAFTQSHPNVNIVVPESIGSGGGIKAVGADKYQVGRVARSIKDKEKPYGLTYLPYAKGPVVFFVNKSVGIRDLTASQVCGIYSGKITDWKDVGGKSAKIRVVRREDGDSSLKVLGKTFPGFKDMPLTAKSKTTFSTPETFDIVENKAGTIGFGPYDVARNANVDICRIDGKGPTDTGYPSMTTFALIFKEGHKTGNIKKFIEFASSPAAHEAIKAGGGVSF